MANGYFVKQADGSVLPERVGRAQRFSRLRFAESSRLVGRIVEADSSTKASPAISPT